MQKVQDGTSKSVNYDSLFKNRSGNQLLKLQSQVHNMRRIRNQLLLNLIVMKAVIERRSGVVRINCLHCLLLVLVVSSFNLKSITAESGELDRRIVGPSEEPSSFLPSHSSRQDEILPESHKNIAAPSIEA